LEEGGYIVITVRYTDVTSRNPAMDVTRDDKLGQLERVLQSKALHGSENLKAFLRYVVLNAVDHREIFLKEYTIATEVFGRDRDYDSRNDSVVRVQAGRLRSKLLEYYSTEGSNDKVIIDLPKGHYTPTFTYTPKGNGGIPNRISSESFLSTSSTRVKANPRWGRSIFVVLTLLCVGLGIMALYYRSEARRNAALAAVKASEPPDVQAASPLWADLLRSNEPVLVTFSNTLFQGTAEVGMRLLKPLDSPEREFGSPPPEQAHQNVNAGTVVTEHYTGVGEVLGVYALGDLFCRFGHPFHVKRSLLLNWDDLKTENIVVLGSPAENFLLRDLPQRQDFIFGLVKDGRRNSIFGLTNTVPHDGEQTTYLARQEGPSRSQISEDYALISFLRGLEPQRKLVILAGVTTFGTQAAAEYVTRPEYVKDLIDHLNVSPPGETPRLPPYYQIVVKVKVNGGVPLQISYVTHHILE
jgi:hypothetical protein